MPHLHIRLGTYASQHPWVQRARKRQGRTAAPVRPSYANELWYKAQLLAISRLLRKSAQQILLPALRTAPTERDTVDSSFAMGTLAALDAKPPQLVAVEGGHIARSALNKMATQFGGIQATATRLANLAVQKNLQAVDDRLAASLKASVSVDIRPVLTQDGPIRAAMKEALDANVALITDIPAQYLQKLGDAVQEAVVSGTTLDDLENVISHVADVTDSRAKLIGRDQTSKMNGAFNRVRQTDLGIEKYIWQTAGDERVRPTHADNDGKVFAWAEPPEETGNPGDDVNCRCVAVPYFDLDELEDDMEDDNDEDDEDDDDQ